MQDPLVHYAYRELPAEAVIILKDVSAPPRLVAHSVLVHDVASRLVDRVSQAFPKAAFDRDAVLFGASVHDVGKAVCRSELSESGKDHEQRGLELLRSMGVSEDKARFAYTHGNWANEENVTLEDLLVALADKCWKGKRIDELEARVVASLSRSSGEPVWACCAVLDDILESLSEDAEARLMWLRSFDA